MCTQLTQIKRGDEDAQTISRGGTPLGIANRNRDIGDGLNIAGSFDDEVEGVTWSDRRGHADAADSGLGAQGEERGRGRKDAGRAHDGDEVLE